MTAPQPPLAKRKRAPSERALATRQRVFDAAEKVFAERGFDGATIRDIAAEAGEPVGTIHHHGGGKATLFEQTVARRANTLSADRLAALQDALANDDRTVERVLAAFIVPFFALSAKDPGWRHYARLVAYVSVDSRWRHISSTLFDPVFDVFLTELSDLLPDRTKPQLIEGFIYSVSAMLALLTSHDRMRALGAGERLDRTQIDHLVRFCAAGLRG